MQELPVYVQLALPQSRQDESQAFLTASVFGEYSPSNEGKKIYPGEPNMTSISKKGSRTAKKRCLETGGGDIAEVPGGGDGSF